MALGNGNVQAFNSPDVDWQATLNNTINAVSQAYQTKVNADAQIKALKISPNSNAIAATKTSAIYNPTPIVQPQQTYSAAATNFVQKNSNTMLMVGLAAGAVVLILLLKK